MAKKQTAFITDFVHTPVSRLRDLTSAILTDGTEIGQIDMAVEAPIAFYKYRITRPNLVVRCQIASLSVSSRWDSKPINFRFCGIMVCKPRSHVSIAWPLRHLDPKAPMGVVVQSTKPVTMHYKDKKMVMEPGSVMLADCSIMKHVSFSCSVEYGLMTLGQIKTT